MATQFFSTTLKILNEAEKFCFFFSYNIKPQNSKLECNFNCASIMEITKIIYEIVNFLFFISIPASLQLRRPLNCD